MSLILYGAPLSPFVRKVDVVLRENGAELDALNSFASKWVPGQKDGSGVGQGATASIESNP